MHGLEDLFYDIYELTYKYQMLKLESGRGDYGLPTQLSDTAYIRFEQIKDSLNKKLNKIYPELIDTYEYWLDSHSWDDLTADDFAWDIYTQMLDLKGDYPLHPDLFIRDIANIIGPHDEDSLLKYLEDEFRKYVANFSNAELREEIEASNIDELHEYTDKLYPSEVEDLVDMFIKEVGYPLAVKSGGEYYEELKEVYSRIENVYTRLLNWDSYDLDEKILIFQEALTTAHHNGSMATWLFEDDDAVEFLENLSSVDTTKWDEELTSWLGYELGSRLTATGKLKSIIIKLGTVV